MFLLLTYVKDAKAYSRLNEAVNYMRNIQLVHPLRMLYVSLQRCPVLLAFTV